jgi:hypothetical protein
MSIAGAVGGAIGTVGAAVGGWMFKRIIQKHDEEMTALKKGMNEMKDALANDYVKQPVFEQNRIEMRESVINLHRKIEGVQQSLSEKIDSSNQSAEQRHTQLLQILLQKASGQ